MPNSIQRGPKRAAIESHKGQLSKGGSELWTICLVGSKRQAGAFGWGKRKDKQHRGFLEVSCHAVKKCMVQVNQP